MGDRVFTILERPAPSYSLQYDAMTLTADPQYFSVMQIPLLRGRVFTEHERLGNDHYVVVSKPFVDQFLPGDDPVGKHVRVGWDTKSEIYEILGEVGDTVYDVTKPVAGRPCTSLSSPAFPIAPARRRSWPTPPSIR